MKIGRRQPLTVGQQYLNLKGNPVSHGEGELNAGRLIWRYETSPSPLSRLYGVRIEFRQGSVPSVFVDRPDLRPLADGRNLLHVYQQNPPQLCLYLPRTYEWEPWMRIDQTLVPWTSLWLFYFEEWLSSDDWKGGGEHPGRKKRRLRRSRRDQPDGAVAASSGGWRHARAAG
jgi:hypothetical protein